MMLAYIDLITDKNDPIERLIEESEKIGRELAEYKKEKESLMHKVAGLEELNKELCKNLKEKNKSFMLNYPSDSFRFPLSPEEKEKVKTQMLDFSIPFDHEYKIDLTHNILIQKYLKNRNLSKLTENYLLQRKGDNILNPTVRSKIIFGVACTMKQLHARNVFHRNLKLQDVLLDENHEPKIASFYLAKFLNSPKEDKKDVGTPLSMAPEAFATDNEYEAFPVDVYSYAFFLYMMFSPVLPNSSTSQFLLMCKVMDGWRPEKPKMIPEHYWNLIQMCWNQNPEKRPTFAEITRILLNDKYALEEFGVKTNLENYMNIKSESINTNN